MCDKNGGRSARSHWTLVCQHCPRSQEVMGGTRAGRGQMRPSVPLTLKKVTYFRVFGGPVCEKRYNLWLIVLLTQTVGEVSVH